MITSGMIFVMVLAIASRISGYFFNYLARIFVRPLYKVNIDNSPLEQSEPFVLVWERIKGIHIALLAAFNPELHFYIPRTRKRYIDSFLKFFSSVDFLYVKDPRQDALKTFIKKVKKTKHQVPCLLFPFPKFLEEKSSEKLVKELRKINDFDLIFVKISKISRKEQIDRKHFKRSQVTFKFSK
jgi:hypothetical protein